MSIRNGLLLLLLLICNQTYAQHLYKRISLEAKNKRLEDVLDSISKKNNFFFSYSGSAFNKDSIITLSAKNEEVRDLLDRIFRGKVGYKEIDNYIILRSSALRFYILPDQMTASGEIDRISGFVIDEHTGKKVPDASVYEKRLLRSALTNREGHFNLRFRGENKSVVLTVSKENYKDTTMMFLPGLTVNSGGYVEPADEEDGKSVSSLVERLGLARFLISSRQRIQSLNLAGFISNSPFQASLIPGLSSHGMLSSQIINKGSLNLIGGYTAGVKGIEVAGVFNISKSDVRQFQVAGLLNSVGGSVTGFQVAGLMNSVLDSVTGFQVAGLINNIRSEVSGFQAAGLANRDRKSFSGFQVGGFSNLVSGKFSGMQVAGLMNKTSQSARGMQISGINLAQKDLKGVQIGLFNYAKNIKGLQIGFFNVADSVSGYSLGIFNFNRKGYHKLSLSANDVTNTNIAVKLGNANLYTSFSVSANLSQNEKVYGGGLGLGHDFFSENRVSIATELTSSMLYLNKADGTNLLNKFQTNIQVKITEGIRLFTGPVYSVYFSNSTTPSGPGYKNNIAPERAREYTNNTSGWLGWNAGVTFF